MESGSWRACPYCGVATDEAADGPCGSCETHALNCPDCRSPSWRQTSRRLGGTMLHTIWCPEHLLTRLDQWAAARTADPSDPARLSELLLLLGTERVDLDLQAIRGSPDPKRGLAEYRIRAAEMADECESLLLEMWDELVRPEIRRHAI